MNFANSVFQFAFFWYASVETFRDETKIHQTPIPAACCCCTDILQSACTVYSRGL